MKQRNNLIIFTGPSGVGKGTVVNELFKNIDDLEFSVSCTTRSKRPQEREGDDYFFVDRDQFETMIREDKFLEWAEFVGNYYGTPRDFVGNTLKRGKDVFLEIEVQGALQVMQKCPEAISIFLVPPSLEELEKRLRKRGTESEEVLQQRLQKAKEEMKYTGSFKYTLVNDDINYALAKLRNIILESRVILY